MPFYQKGDVRIRYEETASGFPLLVTPGGGLNSRVSNWPTAVFNAMEAFKNDFRCITMDQRNANGGPNRPARCRSTTRGMRLPTTSSG
jgi:pimeloyl-ACP methyl ester carboxylesterase